MDIETKKRQINKLLPKLNNVTCFRVMRFILENKIKYTKNKDYYLVNLANCTEKQIDMIHNIIFNDKYQELKPNTNSNVRDLSWLDKIAI